VRSAIGSSERMNTGVIKVADQRGVYVIKMLGDVRLTLSLSFDEFIETMFASVNFSSVIFDLTDAEAIDSTTLGLMAKVSLRGRALGYADPMVLSGNLGITRLLDSMGFGEILQVIDSADTESCNFSVLPTVVESEDETALRAKVLEAHKILIDIAPSNYETFKDLINSLENEK